MPHRPTILRFALLLAAVLLGSIKPSAASVNLHADDNVVVVNLTDLFFDVAWTSRNAEQGWVEWGTTPSLGNRTDDVRGSNTVSRNHLVSIDAPDFNTTYYFRVISGGRTLTRGGQPYSVRTFPVAFPGFPSFVNGSATVPASNCSVPQPDVLVFGQLENANGSGSTGRSTLAAVLTQPSTNNEFLHDMSLFFNPRTRNTFSYSEGDRIWLWFQGGDHGTADRQVTFLANLVFPIGATCLTPPPSPTPTPTNTRTASPTRTPTTTPTRTPTPTSTSTQDPERTWTSTPTTTPTPTPSTTPTATPSPTGTATQASTSTYTPSPTSTTPPTSTPSPSGTVIHTPTPENTSTPTPSPTLAGPPVSSELRSTKLEHPTNSPDLHLEARLWNRSTTGYQVSWYVAVEVGGSFYFFPDFTLQPAALADAELPAGFESGWFTLLLFPYSLELVGAPSVTWYSAMLDQSGALLGELSSAETVW